MSGRATPPPPPPHAARSEEIKIKSRDVSTYLGATQVSVHLAPIQDSFGSSTRPVGVVPQVLHFHKPPPTLGGRLNPHLCLQCRCFTIPRYANAQMLLCTPSVHSFFFPPSPLRSVPSRFPNMICFGTRPPLTQMIAPAHKKPLFVRNVVSMLSHRIISRTRLYEVN